MGQSADLFDLQRILLRSKSKLSDNAQQNITRWAVWYAAQMLKANKAEFEALQAGHALFIVVPSLLCTDVCLRM